jgi:streptogramin lyase
VDPEDGTLRGVLDMHEYAREAMGIGWDDTGKMLWVVDREGWMIHLVHPPSGDKLYSFNSKGNMSQLSKHNSGIAYGDGAVWVIRSMNSADCNTISRLAPVSCGQLDRIVIPPAVFTSESRKRYAYNVAYLNDALWIAPYMAGGTLYKLDPKDGAILRTLQGPGGNGQIGIAAGEDGCLWLATQHGDAQQRKAFLVDTGDLPADNMVSVEPNSGVVPAGKTTKVTVEIDVGGDQAGGCSAAIHLHSSDPSESHIEIPITIQ